VDAVNRVGEVVRQGSAAVIVPGVGGLYCVSMAGDWRVCIGFGDLPRSSRDSFRQAVITELGSRLGDQVTVSSNATRISSGTQIFLYAPSIELADEAAQVAREVLARRNISVGTVRTEGWSWREQGWRDADEVPVESAAEQERARHAYLQEQQRATSVRTGFPAYQVRFVLPSHRDVVALAGDLAAQGWRVRRGIRSLIVWANCYDDATGLARALSGDGSAVADTAIRVRRVSLRYMWAASGA
jgi:hypothetical protein